MEELNPEFEQWLKELKDCAIAAGFDTDAAASYVEDREAWIGYYADGFSPDDALQEDLSNA